MWTAKILEETIHARLADYQLVVVSNRQPYSHLYKGRQQISRREPGGLVTALDPVMRAAQGIWIAAGGGDADRDVLDAHGRVKLPPDNPRYELRRLFFSKEERDAYYYGYCNEGLWPLCHVAYTRPLFQESDWSAYQSVNRKFAEAILKEVGDRKAFIWIQDFHLILVAKYLREAGASNIITSLFWHIPWPNPEIFRICPQRKEILEGLMAYDLIGFQIKYHCDNFLATVDLELESRIDRERNGVVYQGHETMVRPFPISVDFQGVEAQTDSEDGKQRMERLREDLSLGDRKLILGVDRLDYTKGIPERLRVIDRFLERYPEYHGKFIFYQVGQISRLHVPRYKQLNDEINTLVEEINWKHSQGSWVPIVLTRIPVPYPDILALYRLADVCIVSSLHDGMNLVAKEFVSCRSDQKGVLLLSAFTGAAREMTDALIINPYDIELFADAVHQALEMSVEEQEKRMRKLREVVGQQNIYRWAGKVLAQLLKFEFQEA